MSTASAWHKKQHKKQVLKNKTARLAARDAKVVETKSLADIDAEIRTLERPYKQKQKDGGGGGGDKESIVLPHGVKSKLERLHKERKLLQADLDKRQKEASAFTIKQQSAAAAAAASFVPLERPQVSIYYDAVMNPFGEPPPGQPRLYHCRGGGVTRQLQDAWVPGELLPPPPPPRQGPPDDARNKTAPHGTVSRPPPQQQRYQSRSAPPNSRKPQSQAAVDKTTSSSNDKHRTKEKQPSAITAAVSKYLQDPTRLPELPQPSAAVKRTRGGAAVDIWANEDEVEYEATIGTFAGLDGSVAVERPQHNDADCDYYYRDASGQPQGPFGVTAMQQWVQAGFFGGDTLVQTSKSNDFRPRRQVKVLASILPSNASVAVAAAAAADDDSTHHDGDDDNTIARRIAKLKQDGQQQQQAKNLADAADGSVQARIARLKGQQQQQEGAPNDFVQAGIAAMKQPSRNDDEGDLQTRIAAPKQPQNEPFFNNEPQIDSIQARIAALKQHGHIDDNDDSVRTRIAALKQPQHEFISNDEPPIDSVQARIAALKHQAEYPVQHDEAEDVVVKADKDGDGDNDIAARVVTYKADASRDNGGSANDTENLATTLRPDICAEEGFSNAYPLIDDDEPPAYPLDDTEVAPYPVDDMEYPVDDDYPNDAYPASDAYPVAEPYPEAYTATDEHPAGEVEQREPPKKKIKTDKEVVAFVPSHLHKSKKK